MKIVKYTPSEALRPYVNAILVAESDVDVTNNLLPGTAPVMAFRFKGKIKMNDAILPGFVITGISKVARSLQYVSGSGVLLVLFNEGAATALTDVPLHEFSGSTVDLANVFPAGDLYRLEEHLDRIGTDGGKVSAVEQFLFSHLKRKQKDAAIGKAIDIIKAGNGSFRIKELVSVLNTNIDSFEKKFRTQVGISPKSFSSIIRVRSIINNYRPGQNLTAIAYDMGFTDQAHFNRDFKAFTGQNPTAFFKSVPQQW